MKRSLQERQAQMRSKQPVRRPGRPPKPPLEAATVLRLARAYAMELLHAGHDTVFVARSLAACFPAGRVRLDLVEDVVASWELREDV